MTLGQNHRKLPVCDIKPSRPNSFGRIEVKVNQCKQSAIIHNLFIVPNVCVCNASADRVLVCVVASF